MQIKSVNVDSSLHLLWQNGEESEYSFLWLRDNARDPANFDSRSHQRLVYTAAIDPDIRPVSTTCSDDGNTLIIHWPDAGDTPYSSDFLYQYKSPNVGDLTSPTFEPWLGQTEAEEIPFSEVAANSRLPLALARKGFALITGCPATTESVEVIAGELGYVRNSIFGGIWTFEDDQAMEDSAYSADALRPHTDGTYCLDPPGVQILLCLEKAGEGGESILVDGFSVATDIRDQHPDDYKTLSTLAIKAVYRGDGTVLKAHHPVFREDRKQLRQVCFNNYDRHVMRLAPDNMDALYRGIRRVDTMFNDPARQWRQIGRAHV